MTDAPPDQEVTTVLEPDITKRRDNESDTRHALRHAATRTKRRIEAETAEASSFAFAHSLGASLRDIEAATGVPHMTVKRRIEAATVADLVAGTD